MRLDINYGYHVSRPEMMCDIIVHDPLPPTKLEKAVQDAKGIFIKAFLAGLFVLAISINPAAFIVGFAPAFAISMMSLAFRRD